MFKKILIANRGAIARRVIRACNDLGVASVAVYSDADHDAPYLLEASETVALSGLKAADTYLNIEALLQAVSQTGADAVHPGYGFLAENADFAERLDAKGVQFIGPASRWLRDMGDKVRARALMAKLGFPTHAGSDLVADLEQARNVAEALGYPLMLKPTGGGGGIGMQVVEREEDLLQAFNRSTAIAQQSFGTSGLYLERYLAAPRHIEFQILADRQGNAMHLFERDCSIQRRHQKVIEEAPAPGLSRADVDAVAKRAVQAVQEMGYDNVGTVETLAESGAFGFLEMNTRIQVEHGITEMVTGVDLVVQQIELAAGAGLPEQPELNGFAVEARVYSEDPVKFFPSTGKLTRYRPPTLYGVRVETGFGEKQIVTPYYDPMLAKVMAHGTTREQAIGRLLVGLSAFEIQGVKTNIPLLLRILKDERFLAGGVDTGYLATLGA